MLLSYPAQAAALEQIRSQTLVGEIEGVELDLRHPALDALVWENTSWGFFQMNASFPWDRDGTEAGATRHFVVQGGDRISVLKVDHFQRGEGPLSDPHDNQELWAQIGVWRDGKLIHAFEEPMMFVPRDAVGPHSPHETTAYDDDYESWIENHQVTFAKLTLRLDRLGVGDQTGVAGEWLRLAKDMRGQLDCLLSHLGDNAEIGAELVELAATIGYALGRAEAASNLTLPALRGLKSKSSLSAATEAARRANRKPETDEMMAEARRMGEANPNLSLSGCADVLAAKFNRDSRNVRESIKSLFERRTLANGKVEYRPKRVPPTA